MRKRHGTQAGDPPKAAKAMYEFAAMEDPPPRAVVGTDAYARIMKKIEDCGDNYRQYEKISNSADVDGGEPEKTDGKQSVLRYWLHCYVEAQYRYDIAQS